MPHCRPKCGQPCERGASMPRLACRSGAITLQWELAEAALEHADAAREEADETAEELAAARAEAEAAREAARAKAEQLQVTQPRRLTELALPASACELRLTLSSMYTSRAPPPLPAHQILW